MRLTASIIAAFALCLPADAQTSNVQTVRAWKRTHVFGVPGGTLRDPTGSIADAQRLAATVESVAASSNLVGAAAAALTNALARLYAETNRIAEFSGRLYLAADMDDDPGYENVWGAVVGEDVETNGTLHYFCHYSRELSAPPRTRWSFDVAPGTVLWADGYAATNNATTNFDGYACYDISVPPPSGVGNVVLRANKFMRIGAPGYPLDIDDAGLRLIRAGATNDAYTGSVAYTNVSGSVSNLVTETYLAGTLYQIATNAIGGNP
jgi:hypothetical protein